MSPTSGSPRRVRVAHVIQNLNYGGMERVLHSLSKGLANRGFDVHLVVVEYFGRFAEGLEGAATLHLVPPMRRTSFLHPRELLRTLRGIAPDVVHSHAGVWFKAARAARLAGVPAVVHTDHGRPERVPLVDRFIDNLASRWTDVVVAVSDPLADTLRRQVVHDPARVRVITNGVDTNRSAPPPDRVMLRDALGIPPASPVIGSVGRLEPVKNYQLALRAFARLGAGPAGTPAPLLVIAGDGSERAALEGLAGQLGVASRVRFLGWREDADQLYGAFDLFTLTSRSEGTSISLLEAMSNGVCPVVTDVGGNRDVLGPGLTTLLVPDNDEATLASTWRRLLADSTHRQAMGDLAHDRATALYSVEHMVSEHVTLYRDLLGGALNA